MQQPFDIIVADTHYAVFPEPEETFTIYKDGKEYLQIQKDAENQWLKLDEETALPLFEPNEEVNQIGKAISEYKEEEEDDEDDLFDEVEEDY
jgi:hypothetical protein